MISLSLAAARLFDHPFHLCRWSLADDNWCSAVAREGGAYCQRHHARAYTAESILVDTPTTKIDDGPRRLMLVRSRAHGGRGFVRVVGRAGRGVDSVSAEPAPDAPPHEDARTRRRSGSWAMRRGPRHDGGYAPVEYLQIAADVPADAASLT
jgi:hypothetical protein